MTTLVEVVYTGIVSFVPHPQHNSYTIVVQNAESEPHRHVGYILLRDKQVRSLVGSWKKLESRGGRTGFALDGWNIAFDAPFESGALKTDPNFFEYMLTLDEGCHPALAKSNRIDPNCLLRDGRERVLARIPINRGALRASYVEPKMMWRWNRPGCRPRFIAEEICHSFEISGYELDVRCVGQDGATSVAKLAIENGNSGPICIEIGNTMTVFAESGAHDASVSNGEETDDHVMRYFDLADVAFPKENRVGMIGVKPEVPLANPPQGRGGLRKVGGPNCPPALWAG